MTARPTHLDIGLAKADITPPLGTTLVGYKPRQATSVGHPLRAEALACRSGRAGWLLLATDTIGFPREYTARLRDQLAAEVGIPRDAVLLSGTHTHSGPPTTLFGEERLTASDTEYLNGLLERLTELARTAWTSAHPGSFEVARTTAPEFLSNRRVRAADGSWANEWEDPEGRHTGFADPTVLLVGIRRDDGRLDGLLVNYGCHPVVLGPQSLAISADYPGHLKDALERDDGVGTVVFLQAGGANINPRVCIQSGEEHPQALGTALARRIADALPTLTPLSPGVPCPARVPWPLRRTRPAIKRTERADAHEGAILPTEMQALRAGALVVLGVPGELFSEYNAALRKASPAECTVVVSLANDYIGYLPTDAALSEGAYEARMAPAEPLEGELLAQAGRTLDAVFQLAPRPPQR